MTSPRRYRWYDDPSLDLRLREERSATGSSESTASLLTATAADNQHNVFELHYVDGELAAYVTPSPYGADLYLTSRNGEGQIDLWVNDAPNGGTSSSAAYFGGSGQGYVQVMGSSDRSYLEIGASPGQTAPFMVFTRRVGEDGTLTSPLVAHVDGSLVLSREDGQQTLRLDAQQGVVLQAPGGASFLVMVDDEGVLSTTPFVP